MILLHGLGSDEQDMAGIAELIDPRIEVICLRAPQSYGPGYAWFDIQWTPTGIRISEDEYWESVGSLAHELLLTARQEKLILGGFSQGGMMSLGVLTKFPKLADAVVILSGRGIDSPMPNFEGAVFQGHGVHDEVISISDARNLNAQLSHFGERYEYHEYAMGHSICDEELSDLNQWIAKFLNVK